MFTWPHVIQVISPLAGGGEDELGNPIEGDGTPVPWRGFFGASSASTDIGTPDEPGRFATTVTVLLEPDAVIGPADDLMFEGRRYRVVGEPIKQTDLEGLPRHWEVTTTGYAVEELIRS